MLAYALTQAYGWQTALKLLGILMIAVALPPAFFIRERPPDARGLGQAVPTAGGTALVPLGPILRQRAFFLLLAGSMCSIGAVGGTMQNLKLYLSLDVGYTQGEVARVLSLVLVGSLVGRLLMGYLADRYAAQAGHAPHLCHRGVLHSAAVLRVLPGGHLCLRVRRSASGSVATT